MMLYEMLYSFGRGFTLCESEVKARVQDTSTDTASLTSFQDSLICMAFCSFRNGLFQSISLTGTLSYKLCLLEVGAEF